MQTTILHIHSTEVRPKAKSPVKPKPKKTTKTKSQESSEAKAKSQKPNGHANWLQTAANSTQIRDFGSCSKYKPEGARSQKPKARSQKPKARSQKPKKNAQKNTPPYINPKIDPYLSVPLSALS